MMDGGLFLRALVYAVAFCVCTAQAATYFVAVNGDDANDGGKEKPFRTIQRGANALQPGDECEVLAGTYRESVKPPRSGEEGKPITIRAAQGAAVILRGTDAVTEWKAMDSGIYAADVEGPVDQVFCDGLMMNIARWPNAPLDPMQPAFGTADKGSTATSVVDADLPAVDLTGAMLHILPGRFWVSWTRSIQAHDAATHTLTFADKWSDDEAYALREGSLYYAFNARSLLDAPGEWYYDAAARQLLIRTPDSVEPGKHAIEIKRRATAFELSGLAFLRIEGIRIFASTIRMADSAHCEIRNCHLRYASHFTEAGGWGTGESATSGILLGGHDNVVRDSSVIYSAGNGVTFQGERNTVTNCLIRNVNYALMDSGCIWADGRDHVISHNTLSDSARTVLVHRGLKHGRIEYNDMYNAGLLTTDLGISYCYGTDGEGTVIAFNWAHDNKAKHVGVGIYIDNGSSNFVIHHNVSWNNPDSGIRLNTPSINNIVVNNTVLNNGNSFNFWPESNRDMTGTTVANNLHNNALTVGDGVTLVDNLAPSNASVFDMEHTNFALPTGSPCMDTGRVFPGITDGFAGKAPDVGAYESGVPAWKPGHAWGAPPDF